MRFCICSGESVCPALARSCCSVLAQLPPGPEGVRKAAVTACSSPGLGRAAAAAAAVEGVARPGGGVGLPGAGELAPLPDPGRACAWACTCA